MFEKEAQPEDFSAINLTPYESTKTQKKCVMPCNSIALFILLGFLFIFIGITELISNYQSNSVQIQLQKNGNVLENQEQAYVSFTENSKIGLYLQIQKLTQFTHRLPNNWRDDSIDFFNENSCANYRLNKELKKTVAVDGTPLIPNQLAIPCGLYPGMYPIGTVEVSLSNGVQLFVDQTDLTVFSYDFYNVNKSLQWIDFQSQPFQSWMQQNAQIETTKLIGHLPASFSGLVHIKITSNDFPQQLDRIAAILSSTRSFGNRNVTFCAVTFFQSACLFLFAFAIFFYNKLLNRQLQQNQKQSREISIKTQLQQESAKSSVNQ